MARRGIATRLGWAVLLLLAAPSGRAEESLRLHLPVRCTPGFDCLVQNYPDLDPTGGVADYACGPMTYDGHSGTDIRLRDLRQMERGVDVLAAAPGMVLRVRDGVEDRSAAGREPVRDDRACGNGVVLDHGGGWLTQYCHLRKGSVRVAPGARVGARAVLGQVGLSGQTEFPHLHFELRRGETVLDPFTRLSLEAGCGADGAPLWTAAAAHSLFYRSAAILNLGFAPGPVDMAAIESGAHAGFRARRDSPALVFFGRAVGLVAGDQEIIEIRAPDGGILVSHVGVPMPRARAQQMAFAGRKRPAAGWPPGIYVGVYRVVRTGQIVSEAAATVTID